MQRRSHLFQIPLDLSLGPGLDSCQAYPFQIPLDLSLGSESSHEVFTNEPSQPACICSCSGATAESACSAGRLGGDHDGAAREKPARAVPAGSGDVLDRVLQDGVAPSQATVYPRNNMYVRLEDHKMVLGDRNMEMGNIFQRFIPVQVALTQAFRSSIRTTTHQVGLGSAGLNVALLWVSSPTLTAELALTSSLALQLEPPRRGTLESG
ncbi:hypothetical protein B0H17DRAFT_1138284 [Mycena rosella]|uniref:Uncharacterized protein n=1 Tax=Mycena rosella TaxID=1033263 RepID=A0AAD7DA99_MYCRO|nr:hypothetical protein B0H17DRAFT_1138284 [Mycena rosella]